jgi:hypothetical protein
MECCLVLVIFASQLEDNVAFQARPFEKTTRRKDKCMTFDFSLSSLSSSTRPDVERCDKLKVTGGINFN